MPYHIKTFIHASLALWLTFSARLAFGQDGTVVTPAAYTSTLNNYIRAWTGIRPDTAGADFSTGVYLSNAQLTTEYYDGLGRPLQTVTKQGSLITGGSPVDLVAASVFDSIGRTSRVYLPFAANSDRGNTSISDGGFKMDPFQEQYWFYSDSNTSSPILGQGETFYYGKTQYEPSPLNRTAQSFGAGNNWVSGAGKGLNYNYWVNSLADSVQIWTVTNGAFGNFGSYSVTGSYVAGELYKSVTTDENGRQVEEFKDRENKVVLKKVQLTAAADGGSGSGYSGWLSTYYIYDTVGNLRSVVQPATVAQLPGASWILSATMLAEGCFRYEFDSLRRMVIKKVPGAGTVNMIYDQWDRLVMSQDSNLRAINQWLYTKYDAIDRPVVTGLYTDNTHLTLASMQAYLNGQGLGRYETFNNANYPEYSLTSSFPSVSSGTVLTYTYYDNYNWTGWYGPWGSRDASLDSYFPAASNTVYPYPQAMTQSANTAGLVTGIWDGTGPGLLTETFYDDHQRPIQTRYYNFTGGTDITSTQYSFTGQPLMVAAKTILAGTNAQTNIVLTQLSYDSLGRVVKLSKKISNSLVNGGAMPSAWETTVQNGYDALGHLAGKNLGNKPGAGAGTPLTNQVYAYNIRGWLLSVNKAYVDNSTNGDQYFGMELGYDKNSSLGTYPTAQYNGNIAGMLWKGEGDQAKRKYDFSYDAASRLTGANFNQYVSGSGPSATFDKSAGIDYSVNGLGYDANGNILNLLQKGWKLSSSQSIDSLSYTYLTGSNKLQRVTDGDNDSTSELGDFHYNPASKGSVDYSYDGNGNLTIDNNKAITTITYNYLNLPTLIKMKGKGTLQYWYDNAGNKVQKQVVDSTITPRLVTTTLYLDGCQFKNDTLQFVGHEEGRIRLDTTGGPGFYYDYFMKDHLGNTRMVLTEQQETDFYPDASLETAMLANESLYYAGEDSGRTLISGIPGYPTDNYTIPNNYTQLLSGTSYMVGTNITIKVMAGDTVNIHADDWYRQNGVTPSNNVNGPLASLITGLAGGIIGADPEHFLLSQLEGTGVLNSPTGLPAFLTDVSSGYVTTKPKAFLNWILFDEQFHIVYTGDGNNSGFEQVGADTTLVSHTKTGIVMSKSGFLFVYVSNESNNINVYWDNLQITHKRGRIMEERHYYPFGLAMANLSSQAAGKLENRYRYNSKELQHKEFSDGTGLEEYDYGARFQDPQLGRWWGIDAKAEASSNFSPYNYTTDDPVRFTDPDGMIWEDPNQAQQLWNKAFTQLILQTIHQENVAAQLGNKDSKLSDDDKATLQKDMSQTTERIGQLTTSLSDIQSLGIDQDHTYRLSTTDERVSYSSQGKDGVISIMGSKEDPDALHIHEIRHVAEALSSGEKLDFSGDGNKLSYVANQQLLRETSGYKAQYSYSPSSLGSIQSIDQINYRFIGTMKDGNGNPLYDYTAKHWDVEPDYIKALFP